MVNKKGLRECFASCLEVARNLSRSLVLGVYGVEEDDTRLAAATTTRRITLHNVTVYVFCDDGTLLSLS